jgi:hypothetical protein
MLLDTMHGHEICKTNLCMLVFIMGLVGGVLGCLVGNMAKRYKEALVWWMTQSSLGILDSPKTSPCWNHPHHFNQARMIMEYPPQLWKWSIWKSTSPFFPNSFNILSHFNLWIETAWMEILYLHSPFFRPKSSKKFMPLHNLSSSFILSKSLRSWISLMDYFWGMSTILRVVQISPTHCNMKWTSITNQNFACT